jgi:hypothetical protein
MAPKSKKPPSKDARTQGERFMDFAREHGADDPGALDKALGQIAADKPEKSKKSQS